MRASKEEMELLARAGRDPRLVAFFERNYRDTQEELVSCDDGAVQLFQGKARALRQLLKLLRAESPAGNPGKRP